jgi:sugar phosphate isomerase/epimerase
MRLGFLTSTISDIEKAARFGFDGIELQATAFGDPRVEDLQAAAIREAKQLCDRHDVALTALAYYDVAFQAAAYNAAGPELVLTAYRRVFDAAERLSVSTIASMSGFDADRDWAGNVQLFADRFGPVAEEAEQRGIRIAFENWMGIWGRMPFRPTNMGGSPETWADMFGAVPSRALGLEFDPSHLFWQGIDHLRALREWSDRIYHVHAKDTEMLPERRYRGGVNGLPFRFRIPGYGEINWAAFISALDEIGYAGGIAIEHEDPIYTGQRFDEGLQRGFQVLDPLVHPATR